MGERGREAPERKQGKNESREERKPKIQDHGTPAQTMPGTPRQRGQEQRNKPNAGEKEWYTMLNLFKPRPRAWKTPGGDVWTLYDNMSTQPHLLIAGATGSGKSVVLNGIVHAVLHRAPSQAGLILIDPKRVELVQYKNLPHTFCYASEPETMIKALQHAITITEQRYTQMQRQGLRRYDGADCYVLIDELADLMTTNKRDVLPLLQRLCQIGRAAKVHVIACTQCPLASVIPTPVKVNFDARIALRTRSAQDSRNILGVTGCELLPRYGRGYYMTPEGTSLYNLPLVTDQELNALCQYWQSGKCIA